MKIWLRNHFSGIIQEIPFLLNYNSHWECNLLKAQMVHRMEGIPLATKEEKYLHWQHRKLKWTLSGNVQELKTPPLAVIINWVAGSNNQSKTSDPNGILPEFQFLQFSVNPQNTPLFFWNSLHKKNHKAFNGMYI